LYYQPKVALKNTLYDVVYVLDCILDPFLSKKNYTENRITEFLGLYTPPKPPIVKPPLTEAEKLAAEIFKKKQETLFSNYDCEIRSYIIEYLFKNKVTLDFLEWRRSHVPINWSKFEEHYLSFKAPSDLFINYSLNLEKDPIFFLHLIFKDVFIKDFYIFNLFFYFLFIVLTFLFPIVLITFFRFSKNFKGYA
jgi:hypothetical protein